MQEPKSIEMVEEIVSRVHYEGKDFHVDESEGGTMYVQIRYWEPDVITGESALQGGRKWIVSRYATESEVVQTCLTAALASAEHQVREHFTYQPTTEDKPRAIFGPHFSSKVLYSITGKKENYDAREEPE